MPICQFMKIYDWTFPNLINTLYLVSNKIVLIKYIFFSKLSINFSALIQVFLPLVKTGYKIFTEKKGLSYVSFQVWEFAFLSKRKQFFPFSFLLFFLTIVIYHGVGQLPLFYSYNLCGILLCWQTAFFKNGLQVITVTHSICCPWHFSFRWSIFDSPQVIEISEPQIKSTLSHLL